MFDSNQLFIRVPYQILVENLKTVFKHRFNVEVYFDAFLLDTTPLSDLRRLKKIMEGSGLQLTLHGPFLDLNPGSLDSRIREITKHRYLQALRICSFWEVTQIVLHHGYNPIYHSFAYQEWLKGSIEVWEVVTREAEARGVTIGIENAFEDGPNVLKDVISGVPSPHLGCCLDVGHLNVGSRLGLEVWVMELDQHIVEIHLHDNDGGSDQHSTIGEGEIDFRQLFGLLNELGINPLFTLENNSEEDFLRSIAWLKENGVLTV